MADPIATRRCDRCRTIFRYAGQVACPRCGAELSAAEPKESGEYVEAPPPPPAAPSTPPTPPATPVPMRSPSELKLFSTPTASPSASERPSEPQPIEAVQRARTVEPAPIESRQEDPVERVHEQPPPTPTLPPEARSLTPPPELSPPQPLPYASPAAVTRRPRPRLRWRLLTWFILAVNVLFLAWLIAGLASTSGSCAGLEGVELDACEAGTAIGASIGVGIIIFLWVAADVILGVIWLVTSRRRRD